MTTLATRQRDAVATLLMRVAALTGADIDGAALQAVGAEQLPHLPERTRMIICLDIAHALSNDMLFFLADEGFLRMWCDDAHSPIGDLLSWARHRAETWGELAFVTAQSAVDLNRLRAELAH